MADVYDRFRSVGDYHDIMGTQPGTAFPATAPATQVAVVPQGGAIPTTRRVLDVGRNDYNMQGTLEAAQGYGIPPVMVQSDPYARIAYSYGPSGPIPLIGATSVYPHVVSSGMYDYAAPYRRTIVPVGGSLGDIMAHIERMSRMRPRGGGGVSAGGSATPKAPATNQPTVEEGQPQRTDTRGLKLSPDDDAAERQGLLVDRPEQPTAPVTVTPEAAPETMKYPWEWYPSSGFEEDVAVPEGQPRNMLGDMLGGAADWVMGKLRSMPRNVRPRPAPDGSYPVAPEVQQPMMVPDAMPIAPEVQPYLVPQQTLSSAMALPVRTYGPSILRG